MHDSVCPVNSSYLISSLALAQGHAGGRGMLSADCDGNEATAHLSHDSGCVGNQNSGRGGSPQGYAGRRWKADGRCFLGTPLADSPRVSCESNHHAL